MGWGGPPAPENTGMEHGTTGVDTGTGRERAWQENVGRGEITARNKQISREIAKTSGDIWEELGSGCSERTTPSPWAGFVLLFWAGGAFSFPSSRKCQGTGAQQEGGGKVAQGKLGELVPSPNSSRGTEMVGAPHPPLSLHREVPWPGWRSSHGGKGDTALWGAAVVFQLDLVL